MPVIIIALPASTYHSGSGCGSRGGLLLALFGITARGSPTSAVGLKLDSGDKFGAVLLVNLRLIALFTRRHDPQHFIR
jgi:hypothetical protein